MKTWIKIILLVLAWYILMTSNIPLWAIFLLGVLAGYCIPAIVEKFYKEQNENQ